MLIRIEEDKGRNGCNAMLSPRLLELLRLWWREDKRRSVLLRMACRFRCGATPIRSRPGSFTVQSVRQPKQRASASASTRTSCGIVLPSTPFVQLQSATGAFCEIVV